MEKAFQTVKFIILRALFVFAHFLLNNYTFFCIVILSRVYSSVLFPTNCDFRSQFDLLYPILYLLYILSTDSSFYSFLKSKNKCLYCRNINLTRLNSNCRNRTQIANRAGRKFRVICVHFLFLILHIFILNTSNMI